jgi:hypothetical protein
MQYANFMPGEWLPGKDWSHLRSVYQRAKELKVGVGGPDLLPYKPGQMNHCYPLIRESAGSVPTGIAVQEGNYRHKNPKTSQPVTISELVGFAAEHLQVDYIFWCTQEPFYSEKLMPFLQAQPKRSSEPPPRASTWIGPGDVNASIPERERVDGGGAPAPAVWCIPRVCADCG